MKSKIFLAPSDRFIVSNKEDAVKLRTDTESSNNLDPITVPQLLHQADSEFADGTALRIKRNGEYIIWTYGDYLRDVRNAARAMLKIGQSCSVCILGFNSPEWFIANLGGIFCGGISVGLYPTSSPDACQYIMNHCECTIIFVEDEEQLQKILKIKSSLSSLKQIVQYTGKPPNVPNVISWKEFMALGHEKGLEEELEASLSKVVANKCCQIVYTSGTTGQPKGVMLSHDNLIFPARTHAETYGLKDKIERFVSYLPLSHVAGILVDIYLAITVKASITFADKNALKGTLINTLKECRPTLFVAVPRVFEKMYDKMVEAGNTTTGIKRMIANWAKETGYNYNKNLIHHPDQVNTISYKIADALVFSKVKANLGFDECRCFVSAAAPLKTSIVEYFMSLDINLFELYGMSETTGPHTGNTFSARKVGSVGQSVPGCSTRLMANGEICMKGRNVMMGYLNDSKTTGEVFTEDGYIMSGDLGEIDSDGYLYITGRQKEILITAGGENVPPVVIEDQLKTFLPILSNAVVIGDRKKYLSCLLTLKVDIDPNTLEPSDKLSQQAEDWCRNQGSKAQCVSEIIDSPDEKVMSAIQEAFNKYNSVAVSNAQKLQKWIIIPKDFSVVSGELGPTLKLKRHVILKKYDNFIQKMYS